MVQWSKDLTIVMPLYGRHAETHRVLQYAQDNECPFKMIIADGSNESFQGTPQYNVWMFYFYAGYDETIYHFMQKMNRAMRLIETPLTVMIDNDDSFSIEGFGVAIDFLKQHDEYATYRNDVRRMRGGRIADSIYTLPSIEHNVTIERIVNSIKNRNAFWHDTFRTPILQLFFNILDHLEVRDYQMVVTLLTYFPVIFGKAKRLHDSPYYYHMGTHSTVQGTGKMSKFNAWMHDGKWKKSAAQTISIISCATQAYTKEDIRNEFAQHFLQSVYDANSLKLDAKDIAIYCEESKAFDQQVYDLCPW